MRWVGRELIGIQPDADTAIELHRAQVRTVHLRLLDCLNVGGK